MTKEEQQLYNKNYRKANEEKLKLYRKDYYAKNKEKMKSSVKKNKEELKIYNKKYREVNKTNIKQYGKKYREVNKEVIKVKHNDYLKNRKSIDPIFKLKSNIIVSICNNIKKLGFTKKTRTHEILGCSFEEFKQHLESKFESWMNWDNRGLYNGTPNYGWDIDHIIPVSTATTEEEVIKLNHHSNLQPLCSYTNRVIKKNAFLE
jgi:hypothetical protein